MYRIGREFSFCASHQLTLVPEGHKCRRMHGHNYTGWTEVEGERLDHRGFVLDFGELDAIQRYVKDVFDHQHLNDVVDFEPTAENLAEHLFVMAFAKWPDAVRAVRVYENDRSWAEYRAPGR